MKKMLLLFAGLVFTGFMGWSQLGRTTATPASNPSQALSLDLYLPVGSFAQSHFAGAGFNYSWSRHRFGKNIFTPEKRVGFIANGGADYYFGKKIKTAGYDFRYGNYLYLHALAGAIINPWKNGNVSLLAGPTLGIYKGNADLGVGLNLLGSFYLKENIAIGPGIIFKKHPRTDALWAGAIRVSYIF